MASLLICTQTLAVSGQFFDTLDGRLDASKYLSENAYGFLPVPIIITDPAVDGGLGMMGLFFHENDEDRTARLKSIQDESNDSAGKSLMPPSLSALIGAYTGNNSYFVGGGHLGFFKQGRIRYQGGIGYGDLNIDFYGFGDVNLAKPLKITTQASGVLQTLKFKLGSSKFYAGPTQRYINASVSPQNIDNLVGNISPAWQEPITNLLTRDMATSGAGFTVEYDSRDNFFSPKSGLKYELSHLWFDESIGSDIDYQLTEFSALNYFKISKEWRTGIRFAVDYANSDGFLPPYATPSITMRGIPSARYQALSVAMAELELIYKINFRWEVNAFVGTGKASNEFSDLASSQSKVSKGAGFRYLIARRYGFNMGVDVAKGPEDTVFYIQAGSAW